jgi:hypothetical protein
MPVEILKTYRCAFDDVVDTVDTTLKTTVITPKRCRVAFSIGGADPPLPPLKTGDPIKIVLEIESSDPS